MTLLTIFSAPKPFTDPHIAMIQRNAIRSWMLLGADVEVLLMGDEPGMAEAAAEFSARHLPQVESTDQGLPYIGGMFRLAYQRSQAPLLACVNADIILLPDFVETARTAQEQFAEFVLLGRRWDLDVVEPLAFEPGWGERIKTEAQTKGKLHRQSGSDYFLFTREVFRQVPDFSVGRAGWDNWMIYHALQQPWITLDASHDIFIVHQNHDYHHLPGGQIHYKHPDSRHNVALAGGEDKLFDLMDLEYALVEGKLMRKPITWLRLVRKLERILQPEGEIKGLRGRLFRSVRRYRKRL